MESQRLSRTFKLLNLLHSGHLNGVDELARALGCSKRTVFRDIKFLNENDIRVVFDETRRNYRLHEGPHPYRPELSDVEMTTLLTSAILSKACSLPPFSQSIDQAISKLMIRCSPATKSRIQRIANSLDLTQQIGPLDKRTAGFFEQTILAIANGKQVRLTFVASDSDTAETTKFSPYKLAQEHDGWCLTGRSTVHRQVVTLAFSCLLKVELTDDDFEVPARFISRSE